MSFPPSQSSKLKPDKNSAPGIHQEKFEGFDFIRAIFALVILGDHAKLFLLPQLWGIGFLSDILYANVGSLAVPCFFQVSLFIFILKSEKMGWRYFSKNRLPKLIFLYLFWVTLKILFDILLDSSGASVPEELTFRRGIEFVVSGGNSPFYFFFSLLFVTTLAAVMVAFFKNVENPSTRLKLSYGLFIVSSCLMLVVSAMNLVNSSLGENPIKIANIILNIGQWDYNPLNFIPYIFTAAITVHEFNQKNFPQKQKLYGMLVLFLAFTLIDWRLSKDILHYSRISLVFGSWLLLYLALLSTHKPPKIIRFLSSYSLGIYAFHLFFTHALFLNNFYPLNELAEFMPGLDIVVKFFGTLAISIVLTLVFKGFPGLRVIV